MYKPVRLLILGVFIFLLFSFDTFAQASFQGLGDLPGGDFLSIALDVSADGSVVVGYSSTSENGQEPFRWTADSGMVSLGNLPGGGLIQANGVSADGSVVVGFVFYELGAEAFRWTVDGGMAGLGDLPGGDFASAANGVSADGSVVVGFGSSANGQEAFLWTAGEGMVGLGDLPGGNIASNAGDVSADGSVVVGASSSTDTGVEAFHWTVNGGMVGFGDLPGGDFFSTATGISTDGSIVVGRGTSANGAEAFRWTASAGMVGLGDLPGGIFTSGATDVSADGSVVVGYGFSGNGGEAFIWTDLDGMRPLKQVLETDYGLDLTGWMLGTALGVSDDGTVIVGWGFNPNGKQEAWRAVLPSNTVAWNNAQGGNFGVGSNWIGGAVPDDSQIALFDPSFYTLANLSLSAGQSITVTFDEITTTGGLDIKDRVNFDLQSHSYGLSSLQVGSSAGTPDEVQLEIINGVLGVDLGSTAAFIGAIGERGQLMVGSSGTFEADTDDPNGKLVIGANDCGGGECGRLVIQNGGIVYTNFSGLGTTIVGTAGGEGSVFITDSSEWSDSSLVIIGKDNHGTLEINNSGFYGNKLYIGAEDEGDGIVNIGKGSGLLINELIVGDKGRGEFGSEEGDVLIAVTSELIIGKSSSGIGLVGVLGAKGGLTCYGEITVGKFGTGFLVIADSSVIYTTDLNIADEMGSDGQVLIQNESSELIVDKFAFIGISDTGEVIAEFGSKFIVEGNLSLGNWAESSGTIKVSGSGSTLSSHKTFIGFGGIGNILVSDSAAAYLDSTCIIGWDSEAEGEITVEGETSNFLGDTLYVGYYGRGGLSVLEGGFVWCQAAVVATNSGSVGSLLVDGDSSGLLLNKYLRLGYGGVGFARFTNGGTLEASTVQIGPLGSMDASGGTLNIGSNPPILKSTESLSDTGGIVYVDTLLISEGAQILVNSVIFGEGGYLGGEGSFTFDVINSGGLNPGDSLNTPGLFTIDANYTQLANGTLFIELEGDSLGSGFDKLIVNGDSQLAGTLDVSTLNIYEPMVGQTFEILTANNITGTFDNVVTHRGLGVSVTYNSTSIVITVTSPVSVEDDNNKNEIPTEYNLSQNYPNPFNPNTKIRYHLPQKSKVIIKLYDILGAEVMTLLNEEKEAGVYEVEINATSLPSGTYIYRMIADGFVETNKMILIK